MSGDALVLPRRLAIALLAEAQKAAGAPVHGFITARDGVPLAVKPGAEPGAQGVWARYRSGASEPDSAPGRQLLISIDTKGVLQLRCWERDAGPPVERELHIL
jgi:[CysO sulfur-carrier protein]-S-L-cysteine hydrolase